MVALNGFSNLEEQYGYEIKKICGSFGLHRSF